MYFSMRSQSAHSVSPRGCCLRCSPDSRRLGLQHVIADGLRPNETATSQIFLVRLCLQFVSSFVDKLHLTIRVSWVIHSRPVNKHFVPHHRRDNQRLLPEVLSELRKVP